MAALAAAAALSPPSSGPSALLALLGLAGPSAPYVLARYALALALAPFALLALLAATSPAWLPLLHPTPTRGTRATLPNGLVVQRWTKMEEDVLYKEIWNDEGAYARNGLVRFWRGMLVADVGANVGFFSLYAAQRCGGDACIVSVEPIPTTFAVLKDNAAAANAGLMDRVLRGVPPDAAAAARPPSLDIVPMHCAVGDVPRGKSSRAVFAHHPNLSIWSTGDSALAGARVDRVVHDISAGFRKSAASWLLPPALFEWAARALLVRHFARTERVEVSVRRTGDVLRGWLAKQAPGARVGLLKVDVEGAELEVLRGVDADQWPRIDQVAMELESFADVREAERLLRAQGFTYTHWEASERAKGAATSEVCLLYASRESDEEVARRLRVRTSAGSAEAEEVEEVVEEEEEEEEQQQQQQEEDEEEEEEEEVAYVAPAPRRRGSIAPPATKSQRRSPSPAPPGPGKVELAMLKQRALQEQRKLDALRAIADGRR